uniref:Proteinase inhibitor PSI-1.2-like n=1 Tax=Nicotiana sylvestris TaxID=4096 RepID=A0A1U7VLC3_NICSY|nr:PREDICTED: proteinase inhibitor PSI-1.2-like [Nicotiana sylvestris]
MFFLGSKVENANAKACLQKCNNEVEYMTCPSSGDEKIMPTCTNCCLAEVGCKLFRADGSLICVGNWNPDDPHE